MPGQCYSCGATFGVFKKETGCKNCGFAFCKDCLTKKAAIPKLNNEKHKVCNKCYKVLSGQAKPEVQKNMSPPEAFKRRVEALQKQKSVGKLEENVTRQKIRNMAKYRGMSEEDVALAQRLEFLKDSRRKSGDAVPSQSEIEQRLNKLKEDRPPPPSSDNMSQRLAVLRGQKPEMANKPNTLPEPDKRKQQEQIDDLLGEICDEVAIENRQSGKSGDSDSDMELVMSASTGGKPADTCSDDNMSMREVQELIAGVAQELNIDAEHALCGLQQDKELQRRLQQAKVREGDSPKHQGETMEQSDDDEDDDASARLIIKRYLAESALDDQVAQAGSAGSGRPANRAVEMDLVPGFIPDPDELPWCCICNNDASVRCFGCDGDLYCKRCFAEGHDNFDLRDHPTTKFTKRQ